MFQTDNGNCVMSDNSHDTGLGLINILTSFTRWRHFIDFFAKLNF